MKSSCLYPDLFYIYDISSTDSKTEHQVAVLIIEYKASYKPSLGHIYKGLSKIELDEVIKYMRMKV